MTPSRSAIEEAATAIGELRAAGIAPLAVACSGGVDSVLLLHLVAEKWRGSPAPPLCIHIDHRLRGAESDADARLVAERARDLGLPCEILAVDIESSPGSMEERARAARYRALRTAAERHRLSAVLLAHHADDQAESVILRILRGSGPRGLRAIPPERLLTPACRLLRPFLGMTRARIVDAARALGLTWREDSSNRDLQHERNRIRHVVLPALERADPRIRADLVAIAARAGRAWEELRAAARRRLETALLHRAPDLAVLSHSELESWNGDLLFALLDLCMAPPPGAPEPRHDDVTLTRRVVEGSVRAATLGSGWQMRREGRLITLARPIPAPEPAVLEIPGSVAWPAIAGALEARLLEDPDAVARGLRGAVEDPCRLVADLASVVGPIEIRPWSAGMRYRPLGAPGRRRIADMMSERRIPRALRGRIPILADADGVLWAPPCPPAERIRVHAASERILEIRWRGAPPASALGG